MNTGRRAICAGILLLLAGCGDDIDEVAALASLEEYHHAHTVAVDGETYYLGIMYFELAFAQAADHVVECIAGVVQLANSAAFDVADSIELAGVDRFGSAHDGLDRGADPAADENRRHYRQRQHDQPGAVKDQLDSKQDAQKLRPGDGEFGQDIGG